MPQTGKRLTMTVPHCGPCPTCGCSRMIRKTKDADSPFLGWVECSDDACAYEASFDDFRSAYAAARRAADGQ